MTGRDGFLAFGIITIFASLVSSVTVFGTSFSLCFNVYEVVTFGVNSDGFSRKFFATCVAVNYVIVASVCCAGGIYVVFGNCIARSVLAYHIRIAILDGVTAVCYLVGVACAIIGVVSGVEVLEGTTVNDDGAAFFCLVNVEEVANAIVEFISGECTVFDNDFTVSACVDTCTTAGGEGAVFNGDLCTVSSGNYANFVAVLATNHCTVAGDGYCGSVSVFVGMRPKNVNNAGLVFPVGSNFVLIEIDYYIHRANKIDVACQIDVGGQNNIVACIENRLEVGFVGDFNDCAFYNGLLNVYIIANTASVNEAKLFINNLVFFG